MNKEVRAINCKNIWLSARGKSETSEKRTGDVKINHVSQNKKS